MQVLYAVSQSHNGDVRMAGQGLISWSMTHGVNISRPLHIHLLVTQLDQDLFY